jgi:hypothetical protein
MLFLLTAIAATFASPDAGRSLIPLSPVQCEDAARKVATDRTVRAGKLGDMPPAQEIKAVWRFDEKGCPKPLVVRAEVGAKGR